MKRRVHCSIGMGVYGSPYRDFRNKTKLRRFRAPLHGYDEFAEDFKKDLQILKGQFVILKESLNGYNVILKKYVEHTLKGNG